MATNKEGRRTNTMRENMKEVLNNLEEAALKQSKLINGEEMNLSVLPATAQLISLILAIREQEHRLSNE